MDLFEALKSGTSPEKLVAAFEKDLATAKKQFEEYTREEEKKRTKNKRLEIERYKFLISTIEYMCALCDIDSKLILNDKENLEALKESFMKFEREWEETGADLLIKELFSKEEKKTNDDLILADFMKFLK